MEWLAEWISTYDIKDAIELILLAGGIAGSLVIWIRRGLVKSMKKELRQEFNQNSLSDREYTDNALSTVSNTLLKEVADLRKDMVTLQRVAQDNQGRINRFDDKWKQLDSLEDTVNRLMAAQRVRRMVQE